MTDLPTLSQTQIIRALADALSWFEREIAWGVSPAELRALTGRIGELYAAMITRGQMALSTNQRGYDVVSADGERISVKTITSSSHVSFKASTFGEVDRVIILRINADPEEGISIEELLDKPADKAKEDCRDGDDGFRYMITRPGIAREGADPGDLRVTAKASYGEIEIVRYENGAIRILRDSQVLDINVKGVLRPIAAELGLSLESEAGVRLNTQQLGANVIRALNDRKGGTDIELTAPGRFPDNEGKGTPPQEDKPADIDWPDSPIVFRAAYGDHEIVQCEDGSIRILRDGKALHTNVLGFLRPIAKLLNLPLVNRHGTSLNTRQLGANVIRTLNDR